MEFYLIKDEIVMFEEESRNETHVKRKCEPVPVTLEPVSQDFEDFKKYCKLVAKSLVDEVSSQTKPKLNDGCHEDEDRYKLDCKLEGLLGVPISSSSYYGDIHVVTSEGQTDACVFERLFRVYGAENLSFSVMIKGLKFECSGSYAHSKGFDLEARDLPISEEFDGFGFVNLDFPSHGSGKNDLENMELSQCRLTVTVKLSDGASNKLFLESLPVNLAPGKMQKMLWEEKVGSDLVVVAADGEEVECHECVLMVSSDVFKAMFESKMKEKSSDRLEMEDISGAGVRAFLNFIYTSDLEAATDNCDIAFELLCAGDKYGISSLQEAMKALICWKGEEWFNVGVAMRLAILAQPFERKKVIKKKEKVVKEEKILNEEEVLRKEEIMKKDIMKKVVQVLKWFSKNSSKDLLASGEYQEVFRNDPKLAMELVKRFLELA